MMKKPDSLLYFNISGFLQNKEAVYRHVLLIISVFWIAIASLEFLQDYISSVVNNSPLSLSDSLTYKIFWLLFIPSTFLMLKSLKSIKPFVSVRLLYSLSIVLVILYSLIHLFIFSLVLFGVSNLIHESPRNLFYLMTEKLSTRLYISLSIYSILTFIYFRIKKNEASENSRPLGSDTISIKNGKKTVVLDTCEIKWISSEGPCLFIHTSGKKFIVSDSLKNIINTLPDYFYRIHRSTIVNIKMVKELRSRLNGDYDVILHDDNMLRLSRNYSKPVKEILL